MAGTRGEHQWRARLHCAGPPHTRDAILLSVELLSAVALLGSAATSHGNGCAGEVKMAGTPCTSTPSSNPPRASPHRRRCALRHPRRCRPRVGCGGWLDGIGALAVAWSQGLTPPAPVACSARSIPCSVGSSSATRCRIEAELRTLDAGTTRPDLAPQPRRRW